MVNLGVNVIKTLYELLNEFIRARKKSKSFLFDNYVKPVFQNAEIISKEYYNYCLSLQNEIESLEQSDLQEIYEKAKVRREERMHFRDKIKASVETILSFDYLKPHEKDFFIGVEKLFHIDPNISERLPYDNFTTTLDYLIYMIEETDNIKIFLKHIEPLKKMNPFIRYELTKLRNSMNQDDDCFPEQFKKALIKARKDIWKDFSTTCYIYGTFGAFLTRDITKEELVIFLELVQEEIRSVWKYIVSKYIEIEFDVMRNRFIN